MSIGGEREARFAWVTPDDVYAGDAFRVAGGVYAANFLFGRHLSRGAKTLGASFVVEHESGKFAAAVFQFLQQVTMRFRAALFKKLSGDLSPLNGAPPVRMFIETLVSTRELAVPERRIGAFDFLATGVDVHAAPAEAYSTSAVPPAERAMLRSLSDTRETLGFRLVVATMVPRDELDFGDVFRDVLLAARKTHADFEANGGPPERNSRLVARTPPSFGAYATSVRTHLLLSDYGIVLRASDLLLGRRRLSTRDNESRAYDPSLEWTANPAHPASAFDARAMISMAPALTEAAQRTFDAYYCAADDTWRFPVPDAVVEVPVPRQTVVAMDRAALPEWQARHLRSIDLGERASTLRVAEHAEPSDQYDEFWRGNQSAGAAADDGDDDDSSSSAAARSFLDDAGSSSSSVARSFLDDDDDAVSSSSSSAAAARSSLGDAVSSSSSSSTDRRRQPSSAVASFNPGSLAYLDYAPVSHLGGEHNMHVDERLRTASRKHELIYAASDTRGDVAAVAARHDWQQARLAYEARAARFADEYAETCTASTSRVSDPMRAINAWFEARERVDKQRVDDDAPPLAWLGDYQPMLRTAHGPLTLLGTVLATTMLRLEHVGFASTCHLELLSMLFGVLDAYCYEHTLHLNFRMEGPPGSGKSYCLDSIDQWFITGTVRKMNSFTAQAWSVNGSLIDQIFVVDETPKEILTTADNASSDGPEATFKTILTDCRVARQHQAHSDDGERNATASFAQIMGVWLLGHNPFRDSVSSAIGDRFVFYQFLVRKRRGRTAADMAGIERRLAPTVRHERERFIESVRARQMLHSRTEDAIATGQLTDVTMVAFDRLKRVFEQRLEALTGATLSVRTSKRLGRLARIYTISRALFAVYSLPASRHYAQPFTQRSLLDVDPLLWCDAEIFCFVVRQMSSQIADSLAIVIARQLRALVARLDTEVRRAPAVRFYCEHTAFGRAGIGYGGGGARNVLGGGAPVRERAPPRFGAAAADGGAVAAQPRHRERYYAYYAFDMSMSEVAEEVALRSQDTTTHLTKQQVRDALVHMMYVRALERRRVLFFCAGYARARARAYSLTARVRRAVQRTAVRADAIVRAARRRRRGGGRRRASVSGDVQRTRSTVRARRVRARHARPDRAGARRVRRPLHRASDVHRGRHVLGRRSALAARAARRARRTSASIRRTAIRHVARATRRICAVVGGRSRATRRSATTRSRARRRRRLRDAGVVGQRASATTARA